jgi:NADH-quinone oxidoreductase subunit G
VLDALAREMGVLLGCPDVVAIRRELGSLPATRGERTPAPKYSVGAAAKPTAGQAVLSTWHQLVDRGSLIDGDPELTGTARPAVVQLAKSTAAAVGVADGEDVTVATDRGAITLPAQIVEMADGVVWLPTNSRGSTVNRTLGATSGALVTVSPGGAR